LKTIHCDDSSVIKISGGFALAVVCSARLAEVARRRREATVKEPSGTCVDTVTFTVPDPLEAGTVTVPAKPAAGGIGNDVACDETFQVVVAVSEDAIGLGVCTGADVGDKDAAADELGVGGVAPPPPPPHAASAVANRPHSTAIARRRAGEVEGTAGFPSLSDNIGTINNDEQK
jgi:hypothetical protein